MPYPQGAEPAWFAAAMTRALAPIRLDIAELKNRFEAAEANAAATRRIAAIVEFIPSFCWFFTDQMQTWNRSSGSGREASLEVVPFVSGDDPTKAPVSILNYLL